jgi:hypothetical protein
MSMDSLIPTGAIAGLPWGTWLLLIAAISLGLAVELRFYCLHRPTAGDRHDREPAPADRRRDG